MIDVMWDSFKHSNKRLSKQWYDLLEKAMHPQKKNDIRFIF